MTNQIQNNAAQPAEQAIKDAIRKAYDDGYNDAKMAPDNASTYCVESATRHGSAALLSKLRAEGEPLTDAQEAFAIWWNDQDEGSIRFNLEQYPQDLKATFNNLWGEAWLAALASAPAADRQRLRELVDVVWNEATESTAVPDTPWADRMIDKVFPPLTASAPVAGEPFMYGVMGPDGKAYLDEYCVSADPAELEQEVVTPMNEDHGEGKYAVVALFRDAAPQSSSDPVGMVLDERRETYRLAVVAPGMPPGSPVYAAPQASEAVRNQALEEAAVIAENSYADAHIRIRALKTQADKDGGDCAKGAGEGDLHFIAGTIVLHLKGPVDPAGVIAASRAIKAWIDRQQCAALSPTQPTEQGERDGSQ